jgi:hypothetical protein
MVESLDRLEVAGLCVNTHKRTRQRNIMGLSNLPFLPRLCVLAHRPPLLATCIVITVISRQIALDTRDQANDPLSCAVCASPETAEELQHRMKRKILCQSSI